MSFKTPMRASFFLAAPFLFACSANASELPSYAVWSKDEPNFKTSNEQFNAISTITKPLVSKDEKSISFSNLNGNIMQGYWRFFRSSPKEKPTRYFHYIILAQEDWSIKVSFGCDEEAELCSKFKQEIPSLLPPAPPPAPTQQVQVTADESIPPNENASETFEPSVSEKNKIEPIYPADEARSGISGTTFLLISINSQGNISELTIKKSSGNKNLDQAAMLAASQWTFIPGRRFGRDVGGLLVVPVSFNIDRTTK